MFIGGFQNVALDKFVAPFAKEPQLELRCDLWNAYSRKAFTNNGRTSTIALLENCVDFGEEGVLLLPDYLCLSIIVAVEKPGVKYRFYHIRRDLSVDLDSVYAQMDEHVKGIYFVHYFGVPLEPEAVEAFKRLREEYGLILVEDITQTLLSRDAKRMGFGDYMVGSTRKWLPMTDGGILAARDGAAMPDIPLLDPYNEAAYKQLMITLLREFYDAHPELDKLSYLPFEKEANRVRYTDLAVRAMTELSSAIMSASDLDAIAARRRANYDYLYKRLQGVEGVKLLSQPMDEQGDYVPFGLVVLVEDQDAFYNYLAARGIVGEIQWVLPWDYYTPGEDAAYLSRHNLMLHCDQRYTEAEMEATARCVEAFFRENPAK